VKGVALLIAILSLWTVSGCRRPDEPSASAKGTAQDLPVLRAEVMTVAAASWPLTARAYGSLIADEVSVVGTKVAGRVAEVHVDLGDEVAKGDALVTLDLSEFELRVAQAEAQLSQALAAVGLKPGDDAAQLDREKSPPVRQAKARWDEAVANLKRADQLKEQKATSGSEYEQVATAERVAESNYASALNSVGEKIAEIAVRTTELSLARQALTEATVRAPFAGLIDQRQVAPGAYVQIGAPVSTIVRTDRLRFRASLPERFAHLLAIGQEVHVHIESNPEPRTVLVTRISPAVDELSRALVFEAAIENADRRLRTGLFAEAEVVLDPTAVAVAVPVSAVTEFAGVEKVWRVVDRVVQEQVVQTGQRRGNSVEILDGLAAGDQILVDGKQGRRGRLEPQAAVAHSPAPPDSSTPESSADE
jgi:RND family efflux transporter MFP subunit